MNPLALQIPGNLAADEVTIPRVLNFDFCPGYSSCRIEERDSLFVSSPRRPTLDSAGHHRLAIFVQPGEGLQSCHRLPGENIPIVVFQVALDL